MQEHLACGQLLIAETWSQTKKGGGRAFEVRVFYFGPD